QSGVVLRDQVAVTLEVRPPGTSHRATNAKLGPVAAYQREVQARAFAEETSKRIVGRVGRGQDDPPSRGEEAGSASSSAADSARDKKVRRSWMSIRSLGS